MIFRIIQFDGNMIFIDEIYRLLQIRWKNLKVQIQSITIDF